jgi:hypothetical protein
MFKEMPVIPVNRVADIRKNNGKKWRSKEVEEYKGTLTHQKTICKPYANLVSHCLQVGYRRHGHNEIDEPMFTQPMMYSIIKKHKNVLDKYSDQLVAEGVCTKEEVAAVIGNYEQVRLGYMS